MRFFQVLMLCFGLLFCTNLIAQDDYYSCEGLDDFTPNESNSLHFPIDGWWEDVWCLDHLESVELTTIHVTIEGLPEGFTPVQSRIASGQLSSPAAETELYLDPNQAEGSWENEAARTYVPSWKHDSGRHDMLYINFGLTPP